jgi:hypothetical protein
LSLYGAILGGRCATSMPLPMDISEIILPETNGVKRTYFRHETILSISKSKTKVTKEVKERLLRFFA